MVHARTSLRPRYRSGYVEDKGPTRCPQEAHSVHQYPTSMRRGSKKRGGRGRGAAAGPKGTSKAKSTDAPQLKCGKCASPLTTHRDEHNLWRDQHVYPKCSACEHQFHWECADVKSEDAWIELGKLKAKWKCHQCSEFPPSDADQSMQRRVQRILTAELYLYMKQTTREEKEFQKRFDLNNYQCCT